MAGSRGLGSLLVSSAVMLLREAEMLQPRWMYVGLSACLAAAAAVEIVAQWELQKAKKQTVAARPSAIELL